MLEVDAATLWNNDRGLAPVGIGPINAEVMLGTLFEPGFACAEFESGGVCGLPVWWLGAAALLGAALSVIGRFALLKFVAALSVLGRAALLKCCAFQVKFCKFAIEILR